MQQILENKKLVYTAFISLFAIEALSFVFFQNALMTSLIAALVLAFVLMLTIKNPAYGFAILLAELIIGSQGYLLWLGEGESRVSLRIALWVIVMLVWFIKEKNIVSKVKELPYRWPLLVLLLSIAIAGLIGYLRGNDVALIIDEAKRWLYLITLIPLALVFKGKENRKLLWPVIGAACLWIASKTLITVYLFSHGFDIIEVFYQWTRYNLLGEITPLTNGFSRVFLQSQIFAIPAFFVSLWFFVRENKIYQGIAASLFLSVILTSLSRSFWLGTLVGLFLLSVMVLYKFRPNFKSIFKSLGLSALTLLGAIILLIVVVRFPLPTPVSDISVSLFKDRATGFEAAAASRWALLPVMTDTIKDNPIITYGLGKTLTYTTSDPRVLEHSPDGLYTTNAFEWGWLDIILKLGLLGIAAYVWFLLTIAKNVSPVISAALLAVVVVHVFTPYLNHPLGFGYLALLIIASKGLD